MRGKNEVFRKKTDNPVEKIQKILKQLKTDFGGLRSIEALTRVEFFGPNEIPMLGERYSFRTRVLRDDDWLEMPDIELVPGDIIMLRSGDIVPADVTLIAGDYLKCDESVLTGNTEMVMKYILDMAYSGCSVQQGEMTAVVEKTGAHTRLGSTLKIFSNSKRKN